MPVFNGTIQLEDGDALETSLTVDSGRLVVTAGEHEIGNWAVDELSVERPDGNFRIGVEGEELEVAVDDPGSFTELLGINDQKVRKRRARKPRTKKPKAVKTEAVKTEAVKTEAVKAKAVKTKAVKTKRKDRSQPEAAPPTAPPVVKTPARPAVSSPDVDEDQSPGRAAAFWQGLSLRAKLAGLGVIGLVVLGVFAPSWLAMLLMLAGLGTLFLAIAATGEGRTAFLPPPFFATTMAAAGGVALVLVGITLIAIT